jgi:HK97 family phage major capsid protein
MTPEEQKTLFDELKELAPKLRDGLKKIEAAGGDPLKKTNESVEAIQTRIDEIETKLARPALGRRGEGDDEPKGKSRQHVSLLKWARHGVAGLSAEDMKDLRPSSGLEGKALTTQDETQSGFLASPEITNELIKGITVYSPLRQLARVRTTSQRSVKTRKRTGTFAAQWVGDTGTKAETTGLKYGVEDVPVHELYAMVDVSNADLEDSDFNLESELTLEATEQFGVAEGTAFLTGNAVGKPEGIVSNAAVGITVSGSAAALTGDGLIDLVYAPKQGYASRGAFLMRRASMAKVRKLKDGTGVYMWQVGLMPGQPSLLLGYPIYEAPDLDAVDTDKKPILFGDFYRGYEIVDRSQMTILRDPFTQNASGKVRFIFRRRVGGQVVVAEAMQIQKCHT